MKLYQIGSSSNVEEYAYPDDDAITALVDETRKNPMALTKGSMQMELSDDYGIEFIDILDRRRIFMVSEKLKGALLDFGIPKSYFGRNINLGMRGVVDYKPYFVLGAPYLPCINWRKTKMTYDEASYQPIDGVTLYEYEYDEDINPLYLDPSILNKLPLWRPEMTYAMLDASKPKDLPVPMGTFPFAPMETAMSFNRNSKMDSKSDIVWVTAYSLQWALFISEKLFKHLEAYDLNGVHLYTSNFNT
jgi:hypothetical protein